MKYLNLHNLIQRNSIGLELNSNTLNAIHKLKLIELNTTFFSFGFNTVSVFVEISIKLNLIGFNQIQFNSFNKFPGWIQSNYEIQFTKMHMLICLFIPCRWVGERSEAIRWLWNVFIIVKWTTSIIIIVITTNGHYTFFI